MVTANAKIMFCLFSSRALLKTTNTQLVDAAINAICKILWRVGEKKKVILCLPQENVYLHQSLDYFQDGITERVLFFYKFCSFLSLF